MVFVSVISGFMVRWSSIYQPSKQDPIFNWPYINISRTPDDDRHNYGGKQIFYAIAYQTIVIETKGKENAPGSSVKFDISCT